MSEMDARCERCGVLLPDAAISGMIAAEEENRRKGHRYVKLLCNPCYAYVNSPWYEPGDDFVE